MEEEEEEEFGVRGLGREGGGEGYEGPRTSVTTMHGKFEWRESPKPVYQRKQSDGSSSSSSERIRRTRRRTRRRRRRRRSEVHVSA